MLTQNSFFAISSCFPTFVLLCFVYVRLFVYFSKISIFKLQASCSLFQTSEDLNFKNINEHCSPYQNLLIPHLFITCQIRKPQANSILLGPSNPKIESHQMVDLLSLFRLQRLRSFFLQMDLFCFLTLLK